MGLAEPVPKGHRCPVGERKVVYRETVIGAGCVNIGPTIQTVAPLAMLIVSRTESCPGRAAALPFFGCKPGQMVSGAQNDEATPSKFQW